MRAFVTFSCVALALMFLGPFVGSFGDPELGQVAGGAADPIIGLLQTQGFRITVVVMVALYGVVLAVQSLRKEGKASRSPDATSERTPAAISLSPAVIEIRRRIDASIGRMNQLPFESVPLATKIDLEDIQGSHLPGLEAAHRKARAVYPDTGPQAEALDRDLATSLDLIASRLDELLEECGREAQGDFATQRRFVELRHPAASDGPLALPKVTLVDARS